MSKYFTFNSTTFLLCFSVFEALRKVGRAHIKLGGAAFNHLPLEISEGARAEPCGRATAPDCSEDESLQRRLLSEGGRAADVLGFLHRRLLKPLPPPFFSS